MLLGWLLQKWLPKTTLLVFHGSASKKRDRALDEIKETGGIVISTYGTLVTQIQSLQEGVRSKSHVWSIVVFDEANKIKNPAAQVSKVSDELSADMKLLLTGTPIQVCCKRLILGFALTDPNNT
jgi:DNA excision repair protein ERCC-6-like